MRLRYDFGANAENDCALPTRVGSARRGTRNMDERRAPAWGPPRSERLVTPLEFGIGRSAPAHLGSDDVSGCCRRPPAKIPPEALIRTARSQIFCPGSSRTDFSCRKRHDDFCWGLPPMRAANLMPTPFVVTLRPLSTDRFLELCALAASPPSGAGVILGPSLKA